MTLTREQILAMPAGREMDVAVAEHVMGWRKRTKGEAVWYEPPYELTDNQLLACEVDFLELGRLWVPCYSTDIAATWGVVEHCTTKLAQSDFNLIYDCGGAGEAPSWLAFFPGATDAYSDTAPLAICRSALLLALEQRASE